MVATSGLVPTSGFVRMPMTMTERLALSPKRVLNPRLGGQVAKRSEVLEKVV